MDIQISDQALNSSGWHRQRIRVRSSISTAIYPRSYMTMTRVNVQSRIRVARTLAGCGSSAPWPAAAGRPGIAKSCVN